MCVCVGGGGGGGYFRTVEVLRPREKITNLMIVIAKLKIIKNTTNHHGGTFFDVETAENNEI